jgi:ketol-acid reductoisomerase
VEGRKMEWYMSMVDGVEMLWWMSWEEEGEYRKEWMESSDSRKKELSGLWELSGDEEIEKEVGGGREKVREEFSKLFGKEGRGEKLSLEERNRYYWLGNLEDSDWG